MDGAEQGNKTNTLDTCGDVTTSIRLLTLLKDNRMEMMVVTILLYSTGLLQKAVEYGAGVC